VPVLGGLVNRADAATDAAVAPVSILSSPRMSV
jgi:hypothetical protein